MDNYPSSVDMVVNDYLDRLRQPLRSIPVVEREEFRQEIRSHIYEAYQQEPGMDEVARILAVLRRLGEPAEVVADRLPESVLRAGRQNRSTLHIVGAIVIALFGVPLGVGGVAILLGILATLVGVVIVGYASAAVTLITSGLLALSGLIRMYKPEMWDYLVARGAFQTRNPVLELFLQLSAYDQGLLLIAAACALALIGLLLLWLSGHLIRGNRFLMTMAFQHIRQVYRKVPQWIRKMKRAPARASQGELRAV